MKKKILFLIPSLETGGSEKTLFNILNHLPKHLFALNIATVTHKGVFYDDLPSHVNKFFLNAKRQRLAVKKIYKIIKKVDPDIVFTFNVNHLNLLVGMAKLFLQKSKTSYITRECTILSILNRSYSSKKSFFLNSFHRILYPCFDIIITQSNAMKKDLIDHFSVPRKKILVINNAVDLENIRKKSLEFEPSFDKSKTNLISVGRLVKTKRFDLILKGLTHIKNGNHHLTIIGGKSREDIDCFEKLKLMVTANKLENRVTFLGHKKNPYPFMKNADFLILSSLYEGFPNVILEANGLGLPVIAFECPGVNNEIIRNDFNGCLIENGNVSLLARTIQNAKKDKFNKDQIIQNVFENFNLDKIIKEYERLLTNGLQENLI